MKDFFTKLIDAKKEEIKRTKEMIKTSEDANEVRSLAESLDKLNGELGELKRCVWIITDWYRTQAYHDSSAWRSNWEGEGGGALINQNPHQLDLWQWICGMPEKITAVCHEGKWHDVEIEDEDGYFATEDVSVELQVRPRSGHTKVGLIAQFGTVDRGYRGEIYVTVINFSSLHAEIHPQERIAQLVVVPIFKPTIELVNTLSDSDRGNKGFGSSGKI